MIAMSFARRLTLSSRQATREKEQESKTSAVPSSSAASLKLPVFSFLMNSLFELAYCSLISILKPVTQSQYNFLLCFKLQGKKISQEKTKKNKQGWEQQSSFPASCSARRVHEEESSG